MSEKHGEGPVELARASRAASREVALVTAGRLDPTGTPSETSANWRANASSAGRRLDAVPQRRHPSPGSAGPHLSLSTDDHVLLERMRAGEGSALAALLDRYYDALCAFAAGYASSEAEAEEVVEDVFVRLWELRERLDIRESLKTYLYTATRNRALNRIRDDRAKVRRLERLAPDSTPPGMGQGTPPVDEQLHAAEFARAVRLAVNDLPERTRQVFLLHRQHDLTYSEIGAILEISPKTVENLIGRALRELRARLAPFLTN